MKVPRARYAVMVRYCLESGIRRPKTACGPTNEQEVQKVVRIDIRIRRTQTVVRSHDRNIRRRKSRSSIIIHNFLEGECDSVVLMGLSDFISALRIHHTFALVGLYLYQCPVSFDQV